MENLLADPKPTEPVIDPNKDYFEDLVGEGKKYRDRGALSRANLHAQSYIEQLERENKETREYALALQKDNKAKATLEELIDKFNQQAMASQQTIQQEPPISKPQEFDLNKVEELVANKVSQIDQAKTYQQNFNQVMAKLKERYGDNYAIHLRTQIEDLGMSQEELNDMARRQPKVLLKTLGLDQSQAQQPFQSPPRSTDTRSSFTPTTKERKYSYYKELRKTSPDTYFTSKVQSQLHQDHMAQGDAFFDSE